MEQERINAVIIDANVLIDYCKSNKKILTLFSEKVCQIYISTIILDEVVQLSEEETEKIGLKLFMPTINQLKEALEDGGSLSFQDKLCFIISRDENWICVTNDKNLRKKCRENNLEVLWGLDLMLQLNQNKKLSKHEAKQIIEKIRENNLYIKKKIVNEFIKKLK